MEPTGFDRTIQPLRNQILVEPARGKNRVSRRGLVIEVAEKVPPTLSARIVAMGEHDRAPDFAVGDEVELVPHGGTSLVVPSGHPSRMVVPSWLVVGVWRPK